MTKKLIFQKEMDDEDLGFFDAGEIFSDPRYGKLDFEDNGFTKGTFKVTVEWRSEDDEGYCVT